MFESMPTCFAGHTFFLVFILFLGIPPTGASGLDRWQTSARLRQKIPAANQQQKHLWCTYTIKPVVQVLRPYAASCRSRYTLELAFYDSAAKCFQRHIRGTVQEAHRRLPCFAGAPAMCSIAPRHGVCRHGAVDWQPCFRSLVLCRFSYLADLYLSRRCWRRVPPAARTRWTPAPAAGCTSATCCKIDYNLTVRKNHN